MENGKMVKINQITDKKIDFPCLKCISVGRAYELLRDDVRQHLAAAQKEFGFKFCRFHAVFHDDMDVVYAREDGSIGYHWHHIDKVYDFLLSIGIKPLVELNPMPTAIAGGEQTLFFYKMNVTPPKDIKLWYNLIYEFVDHLTLRYGVDEVASWYFEVWNEPNLKSFWSGTMEDYFNIYDAAAKAIKDVCPAYKVGGPATATAGWIKETIDHCHANNVPLDFVTTHLYPIDEYCRYKGREGSPYDVGMFYIDTVKSVMDIVKNSPYPDLEIFWTEFNSLSADSNKVVKFLTNTALDKLYGASCVIRNMVETKDYSHMVSYWVISDIFEERKMSHKAFSGTYGLVNINGIKKATYNAFKLMRKLRGNIANVEITAPLGCGGLVCYEYGVYRVLLWNNHFPEVEDQPDWVGSIDFGDKLSGEYTVREALITEGHGSPYEEWLKMGSPEVLTPFEDEYLRAAAEMAYSCGEIPNGENKYGFTVKPNEVRYMEIHPKRYNAGEGVKNKELEKLLFTH